MAEDGNVADQCSLCGLPLSEARPPGGTCEEPGCTAVICRTCYEVRGRHRCAAHAAQSPDATPQVEPVPAEAAAGADETPWAFLQQVRAAELNFIARLQKNVESRDSLPHPDGGKPIPVRDWGAVRSLSDRAAEMKRLLAAPRRLAEVRASCPVNPACRYSMTKLALAIEGRCCADLAALVEKGRDAPALSLDELLRLVQDLGSEARRTGAQMAVALFSVTGWSSDCIQRAVGEQTGPALIHPAVSFCLVGPGLDHLQANATDRRLQLYLPFFRGRTIEEEAAACQEAMYAELLARDRVFIERFARDHGFTLDAARLAAGDLAEAHDDVALLDVKGLGPALKWRK